MLTARQRSPRPLHISGDFYFARPGPNSDINPYSRNLVIKDFEQIKPETLYHMPLGHKGCYIGYDFHRTIHFTEPLPHHASFKDRAEAASIAFNSVDRKSGPHHVPGVYSSFTDFDDSWKSSKTAQLHAEYGWETMTQQVLDSYKTTRKDSGRGNIALNKGFTGVNPDLKRPDSIVVAPSPLKETDIEFVKRMCKATMILRILCKEHNIPFPVSNDCPRTKEWALGLCRKYGLDECVTFDGNKVPANIFEFGTDAVQIIPNADTTVEWADNVYCTPQQVTPHFDLSNCPLNGMVFVLYNNLWSRETNCQVRTTSICTFRKCISDFYVRSNKGNFLKEQLIGLYEKAPHLRVCGLDKYPLFNGKNHFDHKRMVGHFDKIGGFHSCAASAIKRFIDKFRHTIDLESLSEILLGVALSRGYSLFYNIVVGWTFKSSPPSQTGTNNLFVEYLHEACLRGGLNAVRAPRVQPWLRHSFTMRSIKRLCAGIREMIVATYNDIRPTYHTLVSIITSAGYFQDLGAQHVIASAALTGIINHGAYYASHAEICEGTKTCSRLKKSFDLPKASLNLVYGSTAETLNVLRSIVEELGCHLGKHCRDDLDHVHLKNYKPPKNPSLGFDVAFPGQHHFEVQRDRITVSSFVLRDDGTHELQQTVATCMNTHEWRHSEDPYLIRPEDACHEIKISNSSILSDKAQRIGQNNSHEQSTTKRRSMKHVPNKLGMPGKLKVRRKWSDDDSDDKDKGFHCSFKLSPYKEQLHEVCRRHTRNGMTFNNNHLAAKNFGDGTLVNIDGPLRCLSCAVPDLERISKKITRYIKCIHTVTDPMEDVCVGGLNGYSFRLHCSGVLFVNSDCPSLSTRGLLGFTKTSEAVYSSKQDAARAFYIYCLLDMPFINRRCDASGLPAWLSNYTGPLDHGHTVFFNINDAKGMMGSHQFQTFQKSVLFGAFSRDASGRYLFYVPQVKNPVARPNNWQKFFIGPPRWASPCMPKIPATLIGKSFIENFSDGDYVGKVSHFAPVDGSAIGSGNCFYRIIYEDGDMNDYTTSQVVQNLRCNPFLRVKKSKETA